MSETNRREPGNKARALRRLIVQDEIYDAFEHFRQQDVQDLVIRTGFTLQAVVHALVKLEKLGLVYRKSRGVYGSTHPQPGE